MIYFLSLYVIGLICFFIHLYLEPPQLRTLKRIVELFLLYQLIFSVGITSLVSFIGLTFMDTMTALYMNWPRCQYQQELGNVNLAFGVLGILCIWFRDHFWTATVIGFSIWIFSDGVHHLYDMYVNKNFSAGNQGPMLYTDLIVPVVLCILLSVYLQKKDVYE